MIEVAGLTKYYDDRAAIEDVTFSVPRGQVLGFLGPNGAGKSTTMRILTGYLAPSSGRASIAGFDVFEHPIEARRRIGYLPESTPLYNEMRVEPYLALMCRLRGVPGSHRRRRIDHAIEVCGLIQRRHDIIGRLSRGLRQRVGLAQAVVHDPDVLILDEPTSGLDPAQTRETRELIVELGRRHTVILSSHILPEVAATCERVVIINDGRLVADDTPDRLSERLSIGRGRQIELAVAGDDLDPGALRRRLARVAGVTAVEVTERDDGHLLAVVHGEGGKLQDALAKAVVAADLELVELRSHRLTLEDVFIELTAPEAGDAARQPGEEGGR